MAPSDDDDQRVPDSAASDAGGGTDSDADDSRELPSGTPPRSLGPAAREGVDPRPSGSVVFDVEVDDPSLVMPRPSRRRARAKAVADEADDIADGETMDDAAQLGAGEREATADANGGPMSDEGADGADEADNADDAGDADDRDDDASDEAPRPLVSGDPLLTGPTPVVRRSRRGARSEPPSSESDDTSAADETDVPAGPPSPPSGPDESPAPTERVTKPPLTARDLFEPVTGQQQAVPSETEPSEPPPPPSAGRLADTPPPPPAPSLAGGTPAPGVVRPVPPVGPVPPAGPLPVEPARRAARGAQVTGQTPTTVMRSADPSGPVATPRPTAVAPAPKVAGRRPRVRRVTRVVRHVDPWSVFKVAAVFSFVAYGIALVAGVLLWNVAYATGTVDNIERGLESTGWETFELNGGEIFHNAWIGGLFAAVGLTGLAVLVATLFNLITDLVGGIRMTVLEEEVVEKAGSPMRRFSSRKAPDPVPPPTSRRR